ncbi:ABC transporter permease [Nocardiopsis lambiniae]|uniref:ABC transporter permease n=1 Tax=Nocardiopsis lambiniae TaxID=3075539 RepID=A0ABU2MGK3_9ACTN|nr:ABC transporter permease [Nocardiopsis sp. DSM 44743]MDT0331834.1 ABC transporter permease [Nocardiopsis sp. DSM 44743]
MIAPTAALRGLRAQGTATVAAVVVAALTTACVVAALAVGIGVQRGADAFVEKADHDITVIVGPGAGATPDSIEVELARRISRMDGVAEVYPMVSAPVELFDYDGRRLGDTDRYRDAVSWHDRAGAPYTFTAGEAPERRGEVALPSPVVEASGVLIGDSVLMRVGDRENWLTVTGAFQEVGGTGPDDTTGALLSASNARNLLTGTPTRADRLLVAGEPGVDERALADTIVTGLAQETGEPDEGAAMAVGGADGEVAVVPMERLRQERAARLGDREALAHTVLIVAAVTALAVGGTLLAAIASRSAHRRAREFALLRSVGVGADRIRRTLLTEALIVGSLGSLLGVPAGILLAGYGAGPMEVLGAGAFAGAPVLGPLVITAGAMTGPVLAAASAHRSRRRAARTPPVPVADTAAAPGSAHVNAVAGTLLIVSGGAAIVHGLLGDGPSALPAAIGGAAAVLLGVVVIVPLVCAPVLRALFAPVVAVTGVPGRVARANALDDPRRAVAAIAALMIGAGTVVLLGTLDRSAQASHADRIAHGIGTDHLVRSQDTSLPLPTALLAGIEEAEAVDRVVPVATTGIEVHGEPGVLAVADPEGLAEALGWTLREGSARHGKGEVLVDGAVAAREGWEVGDRLEATFAGGSWTELTIAGIHRANPLLGADYLMSDAAFERSAAGAAEPVTASVHVIAGPDGARASGEALAEAVREVEGVVLLDRDAIAKEGERWSAERAALVRWALVPAVALALVATAALLSRSVRERAGEFRTLRAAGMFRGQTGRVVLLEAVVISAFGGAMGVLTGVLLASVVQGALEGRGMTVLAVPYGLLGAVIALAPVAGALAALVPARDAARTDPVPAPETR